LSAHLAVPNLPTTTMGVANASGSALDHGILGGWAVAGTPVTNRVITMGDSFATLDLSGNIVSYSGYVTAPPVATSTWAADPGIAGNADKNVKFVAAASTEFRVDAESAGTTTDINTLSYQLATGANSVVTIGTGNTLRLGRYGGIFKQTTGNNQVIIGGTGGTAGSVA